MTTALVLDASVIVKLVVEEAGSHIAQQIFDDERFRFWTPAHAFAEVTEVLCRKVRDGSVSERHLRDALLWMPGSFAVVPLEGLLDESAALALDHGIAVYDALYLAIAIDHGLQLVTNDRRLARQMTGTAAAAHIILSDDALRVLQIDAAQN